MRKNATILAATVITALILCAPMAAFADGVELPEGETTKAAALLSGDEQSEPGDGADSAVAPEIESPAVEGVDADAGVIEGASGETAGETPVQNTGIVEADAVAGMESTDDSGTVDNAPDADTPGVNAEAGDVSAPTDASEAPGEGAAEGDAVDDAADDAATVEIGIPATEEATALGAATVTATAARAANPYAKEDAKAAASKGALGSGKYVIVAGTARGKVIQTKGSAKTAGAAVCLITYDKKGKAQRWTISFDSKGYASIVNVNSGLALAVKGAAKGGAAVVQAKRSNARSQKWIVTKNSNGTFRLETALKAGLSLAVKGASGKDGALAVLAASNSQKAQRWSLQRTTAKVRASDKVKSGWYTIQSRLASAFSLFVKGNKSDLGTPIQLKKGSAAAGFAFKLKKAGSYYRIVAGVALKAAADVRDGNIIPGTKVDIAKAKGKPTLFSLQYDVATKGYKLVNVASGLAVTVASGKAKTGAKITGEVLRDGAKAQSFVLKQRAGLVLPGIYAMKTTLKGKRAVSAYGVKAEYSSYNGDLEQKWLVSAVAGKANTYTFESLATGKRLSGVANKQLTLKGASNSTKQRWTAVWTGKGYAFKNVATKRVMTASGSAREAASVVNKNVSDTAAKSFTLKKVRAVDSGTYELMSTQNTAFAADVGDWSTKSGAKVIIWDSTGNANQRWVFNASKGTLSNANSGLLLTVKGGKAKSGSGIVQAKATGGNDQKWSFQYVGGGNFRVVSGLGANLVLSASAAEEYGKLTASTGTSSKLQQWRFSPAGADTTYHGFNLIKSIVSNGHGSLNASYIVIHETANPGATAKNHRDYWNNDDTYAVHYTVDWTGDCYYCVPENRLCWQVGNGNAYVIGIELCHATSSAKFARVWNAGVEWAAWQLKKHGWGINRLISHNECRAKWGGTDHTDPDDYFEKFGRTWAQFKAAVKAALS